MQTQFTQPDDVELEKTDDKKLEIGQAITSPIVGTFYRKPSPDKEPFIKVGDLIEKGDVLCIIEAMKMMNEIKSEFSGTVTAIKVDDGEPVEFDQQLIIVG